MDRVIRIAACVVCNRQGQTLLVRKRGTPSFMQPGGKYAPDEAPLDALRREVREELGCDIAPGSTVHLGQFRAEAANEPGATVEAELFTCRLMGEPHPMEEIAELRWVLPDSPGDLQLAPLTEAYVLPMLAQRRR